MPDFNSLLKDNGFKNMGGTSVTVYYAPIKDFLTIPKLAAVPANIDQVVTISTAPTFKPQKFWRKIEITMKTGGITDDHIGNNDNKMFFSSLVFKFPGTKAKQLAFAAMAIDERFLFLIQEPDKQYRLLGSEKFPAKIYTPVKRETDYASYAGLDCKVEAYGATPAPIYTAAIQIAPDGGDFSDDFNDDFSI